MASVYILIFATVFCCFLFGSNATKYYENQFCQPRPSVVPTNPHRYPFFVSLHRCDGSCLFDSPLLRKCVPAIQEDVKFTTYDFKNSMKISIVMKNHTKCQPACVATESDCPRPNVFENCRCRCPHTLKPANIKCEPGKSWNPLKCKCTCNKLENCPSRRYFDENTCSCKCKIERKIKCERQGGIFKTETCGCRRKNERVTSNENNGSEIALPFWICMMFAEFIIFLLIFEAILFYKNQGFIYKISKLCYSKCHNGNLQNLQKRQTKNKLAKTNSISTNNMLQSTDNIYT